VLNDQVLDLTDELLNSGGSLNDGNQGSANDRWRVDGNWCLIRNWRLNSGPLNFRGSWSLNRCRRSLDWSWNWSQIGEHDLEHLLNPHTDNLRSRGVQVDVTFWFENVFPNLSLCIQQRSSQGQKFVSRSHFQIFESFVQEF
jgi:hypothetical protein